MCLSPFSLWTCLFNLGALFLLLTQVLSVVAQQLLTIQNALKANMSPFNFEGRMIKLVPTCGVFITMVRDHRDGEENQYLSHSLLNQYLTSTDMVNISPSAESGICGTHRAP